MDDSDKKNLTYVLVDRNQDEKSPDNSGNATKNIDNGVESSTKSSDVICQNNSQIMGRYNINDKADNISNNNTSFDEAPTNAGRTDNLNYYISVSLLSIMAYMILAYSSNVSFVELVDLEIPLIIFLSLIIVFLSTNWSRIYTYLLFMIVIAIMITLSFNYSFLFMVVLFSELVIYSINGIINNKDDYNSV